jgi:hypothetical protein
VQVTADDREDLAPHQLTVRSADDGSFGAAAPLAAGTYRVRVRFEGDSHHAGSDAVHTLDLMRSDVRLAFIEPRDLRVDLDAVQLEIVVRASSTPSAVGLALDIRDEHGAEVLRGTTDADGMLRARVPGSALGSPGHGKLIASSQADARRGTARAEIAVLRWRATDLVLDADLDEQSGRVSLQGVLRDSQSGLGGKAVGIFEGDTHIATVLTGRGGEFRNDLMSASDDAAAARRLRLHARFESDVPWLGSSRSDVAEIGLVPDAPPSPLWLLLPLCSSAALVWLLLRRPAAERAARTPPPAAGVGIHPGRGRGRGRAEHRRIKGTVRDAGSERPVRGALIRLQSAGSSSLVLMTDHDGGFRSDDLTEGEWSIAISADGYATVAGTISIPHRGEWADVDVQLESLRSAAVAAYRPAALRVLPSAELWQRWTLRETLARAQQSGRGTESFVQLTERVEQAAYARTPPSADDIAAIEVSASEALARFPDAPSQPGGSGLLRATIPHRR